MLTLVREVLGSPIWSGDNGEARLGWDLFVCLDWSARLGFDFLCSVSKDWARDLERFWEWVLDFEGDLWKRGVYGLDANIKSYENVGPMIK